MTPSCMISRKLSASVALGCPSVPRLVNAGEHGPFRQLLTHQRRGGDVLRGPNRWQDFALPLRGGSKGLEFVVQCQTFWEPKGL